MLDGKHALIFFSKCYDLHFKPDNYDLMTYYKSL